MTGLRRVAWAGVGLLLLVLATWFAVPPLAKWQGETRLAEALGRPVTIGRVEIEPWHLSLTVHDLAIGPAAGASPDPAAPEGVAPEAQPLLRVARLRVDAAIATLWQRAPVIEAIEIDGPKLRLARTVPGHYDIDDLIARFSKPPDKETSAPARFALYNLQLRGGELVFDDRPVGKVHRLEALEMALPFLSNLPADLQVKVEPHLSFKIDGSAFDTGAQATPFAASRRFDLKLRLAPLAIAPYHGYLPAALPVRIERAVLAADLSMSFEEPPAGSTGAAPRVVVKGWASAREVSITDRAQAPLASWSELRVDLRELQPLTRQVALAALRLDDARLWVHRDRDGRLDLARLAAQTTAAAGTASAESSPAADPSAHAAPDESPWRIALDDLQVRRAQLQVTDEVVSPAAEWLIDAFELQATALQWPAPTLVPINASATLHRGGVGSAAVGTLSVTGRASDREARLDLKLDGLRLEALGPYLAWVLTPQVSGKLTLRATLDWSIVADSPRLVVDLPSASLDGLRLTETLGGRPSHVVELKQLGMAGARVDLLAGRASLAGIRLVQPRLSVGRDRVGQWNVQRWLAGSGAPAPAPAPDASAPSSAVPAPAWSVRVGEVTMDGGKVAFDDEAAGGTTDAAPVRLEVNALRLRAKGLAWPAAAGAPIQLQLAAQVGAPPLAVGREAPGALDWNGLLGLAPLQASGALRIERLPVHRLAPYFSGSLPVTLRSAVLDLQGRLALRLDPAGAAGEASGDLTVSELMVHTRAPADEPGASGDELLSWNTLAVDGMALSLAPGVPPKVSVRSTELRDFYSRLVVTAQGRLNLQDVRGPATAGAGSPPPAAAPAPVLASASAPVSTAVAAPAASAPAPGARPAVDFSSGPIRLVNGRIDFTDRFIRPNYSARLTELNGHLGAFASGSREMAALELRGRAEGSAQLEVIGQVNPSADPLALDIRAKATDLELAPLSAYAGKYAGYAIERGKLSMDLSYRIDPDGKLEAKNQIVLNQLTFGERVESPSATQLPVLLAVALLKDRHGVIDINLPVSGSLNDPQFSVGGIVVKVIVNLLSKALTAPFALLAGGGGEDLGTVGFVPGTTAMTDAGQAALGKVAQALLDRPALTMTVTGMADAASEREPFQRAALEARLLVERRRELEREGAKPADSAVTLGEEDRARLLKEVYRQTAVPDKPRNAVGLLRDIPPAQMQALLLAAQPAGIDALRELALQRGVAVRDALAGRGLPTGRLFLAAPKLHEPGGAAQAWTPQAQLALAMH